MNRLSVFDLTHGRELDALVAEHVMGYQWQRFNFAPLGWPGPNGKLLAPWRWLVSDFGPRAEPARGDETRFIDNIPHFSTDMAAAWRVVENLARRGWKVDVQNRYWPCWACHVNFAAPDYRNVFEKAEGDHGAATAICLAALVAVEAIDGRNVPVGAGATRRGDAC